MIAARRAVWAKNHRSGSYLVATKFRAHALSKEFRSHGGVTVVPWLLWLGNVKHPQFEAISQEQLMEAPVMVDAVAETQLDESSEDVPSGGAEVPVTPPPSRKRKASVGGAVETPCKTTQGRFSPRLKELRQRAALAAPVMAPKVVKVEVPQSLGQAAVLALSGVELQAAHVRKLRQLGSAEVTKEWHPEVTHLVASRLRRTFKMMCAICKGLPIVRPCFVARCAHLGAVPEVRSQDLLRDRLGEKIFASRFSAPDYSLADVAASVALQGPLLRNYRVYVSKQEKAMERSKLEALVVAAGGTWLEELPAERSENLLVFGPVQGRFYDVEALFEAACTQQLERLEAFARFAGARNAASAERKKGCSHWSSDQLTLW
eukprot:s1821_g7.t1